MYRVFRSFSFRKKKKSKKPETSEISKPQQWLNDEIKIKEGFCSFQVKYLGNIEVYESRGMQVCEEAIKALRKSKKKPQRAILYVSGDALRVSDDVSQHLIVDQTIEKVSFCAPDRNHDKGFAYICRDGATRRWMCHAFLAVKESGERLSHAVGCAFAICLEKKQKRERDALQLSSTDERSSFSRVGSFRPVPLAERLLDPQSAVVSAPLASMNGSNTNDGTHELVGTSSTSNNHSRSPLTYTGAIPRPHANPSFLERQGSLRLFPKLQENSPFKRDLSLRLEELPSNLRRLTKIRPGAAAIPEEPSPVAEDVLTEEGSKQQSLQQQNGIISNPVELSDDKTNGLSSSPHWISSDIPSEIPCSPLISSLKSITMPKQNASSLFPVPLLDPFSAAPINPTTVHQHQQWKQTQTSQVPPSTVDPAPPISPIMITCAPNSPFLGGPPIAAPMTSSLQSAVWTMGQPSNSLSHSYGYSSHQKGSSANSINPWPEWHNPAALPSTLLLPPEPDHFSDPFDLGWVDRATSNSLTGFTDRKTGNPFLNEMATSYATSSNFSATSNGKLAIN